MKKTLLGIPIWYFLMVGAVAAQIIITGVVISQMMMPTAINSGQMMVNEEKSHVLAYINQTITDSLNLTVSCLGKDAITMKVVKPLGSSAPSSVALELNGTTVLNEQGKELGTGNVTLLVRGSRQGVFNCTMVPAITNQTQLVWVSSL